MATVDSDTGEPLVDAIDPTLRIDEGEAVLAAVLSVGSELLLGDLTDTNATWVSRQLTRLGVDVVHHVAVRDDLDEFGAALRWLAARVNVVIIGGGLGPTVDDLTREAVAAAAGVELEYRADLEATIRERFAALGRPMAQENLRQARVPVGAVVFPAVGTAPAFAMTLSEPWPTRIIALPGVPWELRAIFEEHVAPQIIAMTGGRTTLTRSVLVAGRGESDIASVVEPLVADHAGLTLAFLAHATGVEIRLTVSDRDVEAARMRSQPVVDAIARALGASVAAIDDESLEHVVIRALVERGQTVAFAESATAGAVAGRLARVEGASKALVGGVAVYTPQAKQELLGIPEELVDRHAGVGEEVTRALAQAVRERLGADWGVAVTGVAGGEPVGGHPPGSMFWAVAGPHDRVEAASRTSPGDRALVLTRLGTAALELLRRQVLDT